MPEISANGLKIHFQTLGLGTPIVMIHGLLVGNMASWYFGAGAELSKNHELLLYDLRGHGLSEKTLAGYDLKTMVDDLEALLAVKNFSRVSIVGHSYGGLIALHFALRHPEMVEKLVLVEAPLPPSKGAELDSFFSKDITAVVEALPDHLRLMIFSKTRQAKLFLERLKFLLCETDLIENLRNEIDVIDAKLEELFIPTLLLYGTKSHLGEVGRRLLNALPEARLDWIEGSHYLPSECPQELTQKMGAFFE